MLIKQLRFALRRLSRHKMTTVINTLGLSFGIVSCLVIFLYVAYEFSYDKFHADRDRIYRVIVWTDEPTRGYTKFEGGMILQTSYDFSNFGLRLQIIHQVHGFNPAQ